MKFPERKRRTGSPREELERKIDEGISACRKLIFRFALTLQEKTKNISLAGLRAILVIFCLLWGGLNALLVWKSLDPEVRSYPSFQKLLMPKTYDQPVEAIPTEPLPSDAGKSRVQQFVDSMRTLSASEQGRRVYDSILQARPQLMDSIRRLQELQSK